MLKSEPQRLKPGRGDWGWVARLEVVPFPVMLPTWCYLEIERRFCRPYGTLST